MERTALRVRLSALLLLAHPLRAAWQPALQVTTGSHARSRSATRYGKPVLQASTRERVAADWSFLDATYVITCPAADGTNPRLDNARRTLSEVGLDEFEPCEFQPDDEDRVRGCYTSHIAVLEEAERRFEGTDDLNVLVIEDNLSLSTRLCGSTLESVRSFLSGSGAARDVMHLAYIMYVPGLSVSRVERAQGGREESIVLLKSSIDSVLGTTAYVITRSGIDAVLREHRRVGYVDAIPNVMARLFPDSRFAAYPMPFHRAAAVKSLVNGQLDSLRALLFKPEIYTWWERLLVGSGLSTNVLFPSLVLVLLLASLGGGAEVVSALAAKSRGEEVGLILPMLSALLAAGGLAVVGYGLAVAPAPQPQEPGNPSTTP